MPWTLQRSQDWYNNHPWLCGFNYVPSTAVNSTEIWQRETFDLPAIHREFAWAQEIGFNCCRIFLQYLVWEEDAGGLLDRMNQFLDVASRHGLATLFVPFDDCAFAGKEPHLGAQDEPVPGVHNSGWTASPGAHRSSDRAAWPHLEGYLAGIIGHFASDPRVLAWDLYNEPGNNNLGDRSLPLLQACFTWARAANPTQPLTTGIWTDALPNINEFITSESDIVTFHDYSNLESLRKLVGLLRSWGRPLLCTEWMRRDFGSHFETHLPYFRSEGIGSFFWGLVNGRTQTHFPWGSPRGAPEPRSWFHDLVHTNGTPYRSEEITLIRKMIFDSARSDKPLEP